MSQRAYKTKLVVNNHERRYLEGCAGTSRYVYNWALAESMRLSEEAKAETGKPKTPSARNQLKKEFNKIKVKSGLCPWIVEYPYVITEAAFDDLDSAYKHFFRRVKNGETPGYPKFKSRYGPRSFRLRGNIRVENGRIRLPRIGWMRLAESDYVPDGPANFATLSRAANDDTWYIAVNMDFEPEPVDVVPGALGIDLGVKVMAVDSDGDVYENPSHYRTLERKRARLARELSRRQGARKGEAKGANFTKTKRKIAKLDRKIAESRKHAQHNVSRAVTYGKRPSVIVLEDLNVKGMMAKAKPKEREDGEGYAPNGRAAKNGLSKSLADVGLGELRRQIEYKASWIGIDVLVADRFYPSSRTCSGCGAVDSDLRLSDRTYRCDHCGLVIDRDLNAAVNLAALGEPVMHGGLPVELDGLPSTVKQEVGTLR